MLEEVCRVALGACHLQGAGVYNPCTIILTRLWSRLCNSLAALSACSVSRMCKSTSQ